MTWCRYGDARQSTRGFTAVLSLRRKYEIRRRLDLGQSADPTAIAVLQHVRGVMDGPQQFRAPSRIERAHPGEGGAL